jgi:hypothetical protein
MRALAWTGDNKGGCDHPGAGQVLARWSLDVNRTALYVHAVLPASRDAFSSETYEKITLCLNTGRSKLLNNIYTHFANYRVRLITCAVL